MLAYQKTIIKITGLLLIVGLIGFVAVQFMPVLPRTNPLVVSEPNWDSPQTRALAARACYDCHSNETVWPPYARVAPVSWLIVREVNEGRHELNFSRWKQGENEEGGEVIEQMRKGQMPPRQYLLMHPEARLTEAEVEQLIAGFRATFGSGGEDEAGEEDEAYGYGAEEDEDEANICVHFFDCSLL